MHTIPLDTVELKKRKKTGRAVIWHLMEKMGTLNTYVPGTVITVLFGLAECFTLPSFFVFSLWYASVQKTGKPLRGAESGLLCLFFLKLLWGLEINIGVALIFLSMAILLRKPVSTSFRMYLFLCISLGTSVIFQLNGNGTAERVFRLLGGAMLAICIMPALLRSFEMLMNESQREAEDDILCVSIPAMIFLAGAVHISLFSMNLGLVIAGLMILMIGWCCGSLMGAAAGIGLGLAVVGGGQHVVHMVYMPLAGMLCGCFRDRHRVLTAAVYGGTAAALVYVLMQELPMHFWVNQMAAVLLFLMIPGGKMKKWRKWVLQLQWKRPKENEFLRFRVLQWVDNIRRLAQVLPLAQIPMENMETECETLAEKLCDQCERLPICWHEEYEKTKQGMMAVLGCEDVQLPVINENFGECARLINVPKLLHEIQLHRNEIRDRNKAAAYGRDMMEMHLLALSQAAQIICLEGMMADEEEGQMETQIGAVLEKMHFDGSILFVKKVDGHLTIGIRSERMAIQPAMLQRIVRQISMITGKNMYPAEQKGGRLILEETPHYDLITGHASASAAKQESGSIPANGDAVLIRAISGSRVIFAISDGMGHGLQARNESKRTLEMLSGCMETGYDTEQTMRVVNGAMLTATGGETFATLDMGIVDLWTGETRICKLGACSSFIIQGQKISRLSGEALPLGILEHVYPAEKNIRLEEDDRILMMSDGVADLFISDDEVIRLIQKYRKDMPQTAAEMILQEALDRQEYTPSDDMTVLCVQLVSRYVAKQYKKSIPA